MTTRKKPQKKKRGGQQGNKNALRHGFYSKDFTPDEVKRLDVQGDHADLNAETIMLCVMIDRLKEQIDFDEKKITDANGNTFRDDHYLRQLHTLSTMLQSKATLVRTQYLIRGKSGDINNSILEALELVRLDLGIA